MVEVGQRQLLFQQLELLARTTDLLEVEAQAMEAVLEVGDLRLKLRIVFQATFMGGLEQKASVDDLIQEASTLL